MTQVHGNIHRLQCTRGRGCRGADGKITDAWEPDEEVKLQLSPTFRCTEALPLPTCHACGSLARPNLWFCTDHGRYTSWSKVSLDLAPALHSESARDRLGSLPKRLSLSLCPCAFTCAEVRSFASRSRSSLPRPTS